MINIYKQKLTNLQQGIIRLLFVKAGGSMNQRQIANFLEVTQPAVIKALPGLEKSGLITVQQDKLTRRWSVEFNRNNHEVMQLKRIDNLKQIYESGLADFLERELAGGTIILFGSYSRGEDVIHSDIDIAVIGRKDKLIDVTLYENILERKINLNFYNNFKNINKHLRENLCNGILLSGGVEL